jgi:hypothetical protein
MLNKINTKIIILITYFVLKFLIISNVFAEELTLEKQAKKWKFDFGINSSGFLFPFDAGVGYNIKKNLKTEINIGFDIYKFHNNGTIKNNSYLYIQNSYLVTLFNIFNMKIYAGGGLGILISSDRANSYNSQVIDNKGTDINLPMLTFQTGLEFWGWLVLEYVHREILGNYTVKGTYKKEFYYEDDVEESFIKKIKGPFRSNTFNIKVRITF